MKINRFGILTQVAEYFILSTLPIIFVLILIQVIFHSGIQAFIPSWSDEIDYWHQIGNFVFSGFSGGYFTVNEFVPKISSNIYGTWGPFYAVFMGLIAKITGWKYFTGVYINFVWISLSVFAFFLLTKPKGFNTFFITALLCTFWPIVIYIPSLMQESFHYAAAILLAGLFYRLYTRPSKKLIVGTVAFLIFISLIRYSWILLLYPMIIFIWKNRDIHRLIFIIAIVTTFVILFYVLISFFISYSPGLVRIQILDPNVGLSAKWISLVNQLKLNVKNFFNTGFPRDGFTFIYRFQIIGMSLFFILLPLFHKEATRSAALIVLVILPVLLSQIVIYNLDTRIYAPFLLLGLLLIVLLKPVNWGFIIATVLICNLAVFPGFINNFSSGQQPHFVYNQTSLDNTARIYNQQIHYSTYQSSWCNTLLTDIATGDLSLLKTIPPGIGISYIMQRKSSNLPPLSRYILLRDDKYITKLELTVTPIGKFDDATLYENNSAKCQ